MLDFSALNNDLPKRPPRPANEPGNTNIPAGSETRPTAATGATAAGQREKAKENSLLEVSRLINERLQRCQTAIWDYNKAVKAGRPPEEIALLAARALSLAVSEEMIYTSLANRYRELYGVYLDPEKPGEPCREK